MAGEIRGGGGGSSVPKPVVKKARKLWSLQDRAVVSVHLLKANLAEDGCEEAQLDVAKRLLADSNNDISDSASQCENARLAVYWLIKSSEQGNDESTRLLQECYDSGRGITCQNVLDVKACITTPKNDKLTFKAARLLYSKLSNGEDFITTAQLQARLESKKYKSKVTFQTPRGSPEPSTKNHIHNGQGDPYLTSDEDDKDTSSCFFSSTESEYLIHCLKKKEGGVKLTMVDLLNIASKFNEGELPSVPVDCINCASGTKFFKDWNLCTPWTAYIFQLIVAACVTNFITPLLAFRLFLTFFSLWASYNFVLMKSRVQTFQHWSELFRSTLIVNEDTPWTDVKARNEFRRKYVHPYVVTSFICSILFAFFDGHYFLRCIVAYISIVSLILSREFRQLKSFFWYFAAYICFKAFGILMTELKGYYMKQQDTSFPGISVTTTVIEVSLFGFILLLFILEAIKKFKSRADKALHRAEGVLSTDTGTSLKFLHLFWWVNFTDWAYSLTWIEIIGTGITLSTIFTVYNIFHQNVPLKKVVTIIGSLTLIGLLVVPVFQYIESGITYSSTNKPQIYKPQISWVEYEHYCHRPAWKIRSVAETELYCRRKYLDHPVNWTGKLSYIKLSEIQTGNLNNWMNFYLNTNEQFSNIQFEVLMSVGDRDELISKHLEAGNSIQWNWYDYLPSFFHKQSETLAFAPVLLFVSTQTLNEGLRENVTRQILSLRSGDILEFTGILTRNAGGFKPEVGIVDSLSCLSCPGAGNRTNEIKLSSKPAVSSVWEQFHKNLGLQNTYNKLNISKWFGWW